MHSKNFRYYLLFFFSYLHQNIDLRLLACDPDLSAWQDTPNVPHIDEADVFYQNPVQWLQAQYRNSTPSYIATFTELIDNPGYGKAVMDWLQLPEHGYKACAKIFHAHVVSHSKHSGHILVWCAPGWDLNYANSG